jgi:L-fuculose-phosphate aldolase
MDSAERELVAKACRILGKMDLTKAGSGHVSQRLGDDRILIRGRGRDETGVRFTTIEEVITVDLDGRKLDGPDGLLPPQEVFIHTCLYRARPEVKSVIHIHPPTVVVFTICDVPLRSTALRWFAAAARGHPDLRALHHHQRRGARPHSL